MNKIKALLVGTGGYGQVYIEELLKEPYQGEVEIAGAVDPKPVSGRYYQQLQDMGIPFYDTLEGFFADRQVDLSIISSPPHFHAEQVCYALAQGSNVLCEKPLTVRVNDGLKMKEQAEKSKGFLEIGYQWSYSQAIAELKTDIMRGVFGRPLSFKTIILWPRSRAYYQRNKWAGKIKDEQGRRILDSVAANATAHYLHNMFYILGRDRKSSTFPVSLKAELYRANQIENYDTAAARIYTEDDIELLFYASHATRERLEPTFAYQFEKARVVYGPLENNNEGIAAYFHNGKKEYYGDPFADPLNKLKHAIKRVKGEGEEVCGATAALPQVICINGMQESQAEIVDFPPEMIKLDTERDSLEVPGLAKVLKDCYQLGILPHENSESWIQTGKKVGLSELTGQINN